LRLLVERYIASMFGKILPQLTIFILSMVIPAISFAQKDSVPSKNLLILPVVSKSVETGWSFGVVGALSFRISKSDTVSRISNMQALALYSLKKQFVAAINGSQYFNREKFILNEQISYSSFPDKFWGLGNNRPDSAEEPYSFNQYYIYFHFMRHLGNKFFIGSLFEFQNVLKTEYVKGGAFDQQDIAGKNGYQASGLGLSFTYDNRNDAYAPDKGSFGQVFFNRFDNIFGSDYDFTNVVVDLRKYIRIYKRQVLALQAYSLSNIGKQIPIRSLAALGGFNSMRGFYNGRYRDKQLLVFQSEYRFPIYKRFGAVAFGSLGDVAKSFGEFGFNDLKYSVGGGLRFALTKKEKLNLRLDYGIGKGGNSGLYFQLGEAF
jgi:outer membrane protein assembly factor BamA